MNLYDVVYGDSIEELSASVSKMIASEGWIPCGGVCVVWRQWENERKGGIESETTYYQAVYRYAEI